MTLPLIHELVIRAAEAHGERPAVIDRERVLSYRELDDRSDRLAALLADHGVAAGDRVGLLIEKSLEAVVGIYGVLKAGATYVPLDEQAPARRLAYIVNDASIRCLISSPARAGERERLAQAGATLHTVVGADTLPWSALDGYDARTPRVTVGPDSIAYVLYTSGSTGEPKGVMLSHANGMGFVDWAAREVGIRPEDRLSSHAPFHFDLSTFDLYGAAWGAAAVVLVPRGTAIFPVEMADWIREQAITVWYSVPSALTQLVLHGQLDQTPLPDLQTIIFAGEVFPTKYLARLTALVPNARYINFYGPTETNVCTWYEVPAGQPLPDALPIGKPLPGLQATIEAQDGSLAGPGEPGELLIGGTTVMHGYCGDPERTERVLSRNGNQRVYRTGDLVRALPSGDLVYIGRRDAQIKTRGYRVELGEIETALNALDVVREAAVVAIADEVITNRLKAFVVPAGRLSAGDLTKLCRARLPSYMIPQEFEFLAELPKSSTGKVDRRALRG